MALEIKDLGVKFYSSKTKAEAIALASLPGGEAEPGAICFVADSTGNYIILDGKIFGDGTSGGSSGGGGGDVSSVNGYTGAVVLDANDLYIEKDGLTLITIGDFLKSDGTVVAEKFVVYQEKVDSLGNTYNYEIVRITEDGIMYDNSILASLQWVTGLILANNATILETASLQASALANTAEQNAKSYTDSVLSSIYKVKGSVDSYLELTLISNSKPGDVYNVKASYGTIGNSNYIPPGTNYVYVEVSDSLDSNYPGYWDPLGGSIDLSNYYTKADVEYLADQAEIAAKDYADSLNSSISNRVDNLETVLSSLSSTVSTINSQVSRNTTNISNNTTQINQNTNNITNLATQLTWQ